MSSDAVVIVLPEDVELPARPAQHLRAQLEIPSRVVTTTLTADVSALLFYAQRSWAERWAIVLDPPRGRVTVLRFQDGTILSRAIDPSMAAEAPYAVALTALELFGLAREVIAVKVVDEDPRDLRDQLRLSLLVDGALAVSYTPDHEVTLFQPMFGAALVFRGSGTAWWAASGVRARVFGGRDARLARSAAELELHYERADAALRLMIGRREAWVDFGLALEAGISRVSVAAEDEDDASIAEDDRWTPWFGGGLEGRVHLFDAVSLSIGGAVSFVPQPARYHVRDDVYSEGPVRLLGSLGLTYELGERDAM